MIETIFTIILLASGFSALAIVVKKIPELKAIPVSASRSKTDLKAVAAGLKERIVKLPIFSSVSFEKFLHKALSKSRIWILKIESIITKWLQSLRQKSQKKNALKMDNYWDELKKELSRLNLKKSKGEKEK